MVANRKEVIRDTVDGLSLVDHHVHGALRSNPEKSAWANSFIEADTEPAGPDVEPLDTQIGFAVRAWCAPLLGLPRHCEPNEYWRQRQDLSEGEINRRFLGAAGVSTWLVDTGLGADALLSPAEMAATAGGAAFEVVRLEALAEELADAGTPASDYPDTFRDLLASRTRRAVGTKSIMAYRCGFRVDLRRPTDATVVSSYDRWLRASTGRRARLVDSTLIAFGLHEATAAGLPLQIHVGLGDRDMNLRDSDPLLLTDFLRDRSTQRSSVLLLHCYPFERQAGYLAQAFANVYLDVGLSVNYLGARSAALIDRTFELAPFHKILYSSDAYGPAELHYLGARLWRNGLTRTLQRLVRKDEWSLDDALRVAQLTAHLNARRAYPRLGSID